MFINSFRNLTEIFLHSTSVEGMDSASLSNKLWDEASRGRERETQREGRESALWGEIESF